MIKNPPRRVDRSVRVSHIGPRPDSHRPDRPGVCRSCRRPLWAAVIFQAVVLGGLCPGIEAHALLERSVPQNGMTLSHSPDGVLLVFTEQPEPELSGVQVLDASGRTMA